MSLLQFVVVFLTAKKKKPPTASLLAAGAAGVWQIPTRFIRILRGILPFFKELQEIFFTSMAFHCLAAAALGIPGSVPQEKQCLLNFAETHPAP
ncbi:MAG: hypothetical protein ACYDIC_06250 [Desulfobaccales bacterium]